MGPAAAKPDTEGPAGSWALPPFHCGSLRPPQLESPSFPGPDRSIQQSPPPHLAPSLTRTDTRQLLQPQAPDEPDSRVALERGRGYLCCSISCKILNLGMAFSS